MRPSKRSRVHSGSPESPYPALVESPLPPSHPRGHFSNPSPSLQEAFQSLATPTKLKKGKGLFLLPASSQTGGKMLLQFVLSARMPPSWSPPLLVVTFRCMAPSSETLSFPDPPKSPQQPPRDGSSSLKKTRLLFGIPALRPFFSPRVPSPVLTKTYDLPERHKSPFAGSWR